MQISTDPTSDQATPTADLDFHPAADLFPLMPVDGPEFGDLVADIREQGLLNPIVLHDGKVLDGRDRYRACRHGGVEPRFEQWEGGSPTAHVLSLNVHRRHLTDDQRAAIAVDAKERFEEEAREAQRQAGVNRASGARKDGRFHQLRVDSHEAGERDHAAEWARRPLARAAADTGVASNRVRVAEEVKRADPELFQQVRAGVVPLRGAVKEIERRELAPIIEAQLERDRRELQALADEINPPDFDPAENSDQVRQRGEFAHLGRDVAALPPPAQFIARHRGWLRPSHIEPARAAHEWLTAFLTAKSEPQPAPVVIYTLDGFLHRLLQVNTVVERLGGPAEIAEMLAPRVYPDPDVAIVRATLAYLTELPREITARTSREAGSRQAQPDHAREPRCAGGDGCRAAAGGASS